MKNILTGEVTTYKGREEQEEDRPIEPSLKYL